jgi:hypothetical protein
MERFVVGIVAKIAAGIIGQLDDDCLVLVIHLT